MEVRFGEFTLNTDRRELTRRGEHLHLSPKAFDLLSFLIERGPNAIPKEDLFEAVWPDTVVEQANLNNLISEIRSALDDRDRKIITTKRRFGYAFAARVIREGPETPRRVFRINWGGRDVDLGQGRNLIGRDDDCEVIVEAPEVSRHHAAIDVDGSTATLHDLGSKNGTYLGGQRVVSPIVLNDRDEIEIGRGLLRFRSFDRKSTTISDPRNDTAQ